MKELTKYDQQAIDFLKSTDTTFKATFLKYDKHFEGDTDKRNIFKITLSNENHNYSFKFGSSINDSCVKVMKPIIEVNTVINVFAGLTLKDRPVYGSAKFKLTKNKGFKLSNDELENLAGEMCASYNEDVRKYNKQMKIGNRKSYFSDSLGLKEMKQKEAIAHINKKIREKLSEKVETWEQSAKVIPPTEYDVLACLTKYDPETFEDFCSVFGYDEDSRKAERIYEAVKEEYQNVAMLWNDSEIEELQEIQ